MGGMSEAASLSRRAWYLIIILGTASWSTASPTYFVHRVAVQIIRKVKKLSADVIEIQTI